jgi:diguanylate cyclase (GGDEF)-like protein
MSDESNRMEQVDAELKRGWRGLPFSDPIETRYLEEYLRTRACMVPLFAGLGTLFYLIAILGDLSMVEDVAPIVTGLRLGVFLPFAIMVPIIMWRWPSANNYDLLSFCIGVMGVALPMVTMVFSKSDHLFIYQTGSVSTLAFFSIVLRPRFPTVVAGLALMLATQLVTTKLNGSFDPVTYAGISSFYITLSVFLGLSAFFAEQVDRQNFLHRLRGELLQGELRHLTEHDPMTGLYNRLVLSRLQGQWWGPMRGPRRIALIMLDIDHFKLFNDVHGHVDGDSCIRRVSELVQSQVGADGIVCRYGGEELLILLPDLVGADAYEVAESIRGAIAGAGILHRGLGDGHVVTASLGVTAGYTDQYSLKELLLKADEALYVAKRAGRNRVRMNIDDAVPLLRQLDEAD